MKQYCTLREDIGVDIIQLQIGNRICYIHPNTPYEYEWEGDEKFFILINGKRCEAQSIDFDFSKKYQEYYSVRVVIASSSLEAMEKVVEGEFEEESELDICDRVLTMEELMSSIGNYQSIVSVLSVDWSKELQDELQRLYINPTYRDTVLNEHLYSSDISQEDIGITFSEQLTAILEKCKNTGSSYFRLTKV